MLGNFGSRVLDNGHDVPAPRVARAPEPAAPPPPARPAMEQPPAKAVPRAEVAPRTEPAAKPESISSIGSGMSITGNIVWDGPMQVYGHIEGEMRATEVLVGDSALVDGNIVAQELVVRGKVKGTIRAVRVKLQGNGTVEGDIFHRSLSIEEHALFEGSSRRVENPLEQTAAALRPSGTQGKSMATPNLHALGDVSPDTSA
jgi:cytoskeletal protein CcmA (bactofilin family)